MFEGILEAFTIPEVRKRLFFTLGAFAIFRLGSWIPVPGVDPQGVSQFFQGVLGGGLFGLFNLFTGGAFDKWSIFALGVIPYINASIIMSLLQSVIPYLKELQKQGDEGQKIINKYIRYGTVGLAFLQAAGTSYWIASSPGLILGSQSPYIFYFTSVVALTTGTMFLMWLGERITENGIGRGVSMLIMAGIIADYPRFIGSTVEALGPAGGVPAIWGAVLIATLVVVVAGVVLVQLGARRIEIQYAKRVVRGRVYGGQNTYIPFGVNQGGVIPIIFAAAILALPQTLLNIDPWGIVSNGPEWLKALNADLQRGGWLYLVFYGVLIMFFTYFYSAIVFNPQDLADNLRRWGGFIPGLRPGKPTADYVERIQMRLLTIGGLFLTAIALLPYIVNNLSGLTASFALGGTSILIVVGVGVDTIKQIEAHMVERHYESLIRKGAILGRKI